MTFPMPPELDDPHSDLGEVAADLLPVLHTVSGMVGVENHRRILNDAADRTDRYDRFMNDYMRKINGIEKQGDQQQDTPTAEGESQMGDIIAVGRIYANGPDSVSQALKVAKGKAMDKESDEPTAPESVSPAESPVTPRPAEVVTKTIDRGLPWWATTAIALASAGTAGGLGAALTAWLSSPPAVTRPADTDTDTTTAIGIKRD